MRNFVIAALAGALIVIISASLPSLAGENAGLQAVAYPVAVALFIPYVCFMLPAVLDGGREMTALYALFAALSILTVFYIAESSARGYGRMRLLVLEGALVCMMSLSFAVFMISLGITNTAILSFPIAIAVLIYILAALVEIVPPEGVGAESNANEAPTSSNHIEYIPEPEESPVSEEVPEAIDYSGIILLDAEDTGESYSAIAVGDEDESPAYEAIAVSEDDGNEAIAAMDKPSSISDDIITAAQISQNDEEIEEEAIVVDEDSVIEEKALSFETVETEEIPAIAIDSEDELAAIQAISLDNTESISTASVSSFFSDDTEEVNALLIDEAEETSVDAILVDVEGSEDLPAIIKEEDKPEELPVSVVEESEDEVLPVAVIDAEEDTVVPVIVDSAEESQMLIIEEEDIPETEPATQLSDEVYEEIAMDAEETSAVPAPPVLSVSTSLSVPTAPSITNTAHLSAPSAPVLTNTAELIEDNQEESMEDFLAGLTAEEADFWSSFFIAGEDEVTLADGVYYMELIVNGNSVGEITVTIIDYVPYLNVAELKGYVQDTLTDEASSRIFLGRDSLISIEELKTAGVSASYDPLLYQVYLDFNVNDMPVQVLSISGSVRRFSSRPIAGALELKPAVFSISTRYTLSGRFEITPFEDFFDSLRFDFSTYNVARLYDVYSRFSYSFRYYQGMFGFNMGTYDFYTDFQDSMIRLRWGNIDTELLSPSGTTIGLRFDKSLSYGGASVRRKSHIERILTVEKDSEVQIFNEGREIYNRVLQPGNYRLQDFILYTGANRIKIVVTPLDGSPVTETEIDISYASSLLAPGEIYYGGSIATGRNIVNSSSTKLAGAVRLPLLNGRSLEYDARNLVATGYIRAGLSESLTMDASLAIQNRVLGNNPYSPVAKLALEFTHANPLGTTRYNLNVTERSDRWGLFELPELYARISHQVYTGWNPISALSFSLTYDSNMAYAINSHSFMLSMNLSGNINRFSWGLSSSVSLDTAEINYPGYYISGSMSFSFSNNFFMSASMSLDGYGTDKPNLSGRVSASIRFNPVRVQADVSDTGASISVGVNKDKHSFSADIEAPITGLLVPQSYIASADYSYSGKYFNVNVGASADSLFRNSSATFSISTSSVFADGLLGFTASIPSNFILVKQQGALKGNELSVGAIGVSATERIPTVFDTGLYTGLSLNTFTSLSVFSMNNESFGSASAFDISIPESPNGGYTLRISADNKYSVSGIVELPDGSLWTNGSSPVYKIERAEEGIALESSAYYLFSDNEGRSIISDLEPNEYGFDVYTGQEWILYTFTVFDNEEYALDINVLGKAMKVEERLPEPYCALYTYAPGVYMTGDQFWTYIYPLIEEAV